MTTTISSSAWLEAAYNVLQSRDDDPCGVDNVLTALDWCRYNVWRIVYDMPAHKQAVHDAELKLRAAQREVK